MSRKGKASPVTQQGIEFPYTRSGEIDWTTLGNILTGRILGEVLCASHVDPKYGEGNNASFSADTEWKYLSEEREIVILSKRFPDSPLCCCMGRSVIDLPMRQVADFISTPESTYTWDKLLTQIEVLETLSESSTHKDNIVYMSHEVKRCFFKTKRDFVFYLHYTEKDGKCLRTVVSVDDTFHPVRPGHIRGLIKPGSGWVLEPYRGDDSRTLISFLAHLDLVDVHPAIINLTVRRYPLQIHYIRKHLMKQTSPTRSSLQSPMHSHRGSVVLSGVHYEDPLPVRVFTERHTLRRSRSLTNDSNIILPFGGEEERRTGKHELASSRGVFEAVPWPTRGSVTSDDHSPSPVTTTKVEVVVELAGSVTQDSQDVVEPPTVGALMDSRPDSTSDLSETSFHTCSEFNQSLSESVELVDGPFKDQTTT